MPQYYEIKLKGHLDPHWSDWFAGLQLTHLDTGETLLSGQLPDQTALHSLLERVRDLNIILVSVTCGDDQIDDINKIQKINLICKCDQPKEK